MIKTATDAFRISIGQRVPAVSAGFITHGPDCDSRDTFSLRRHFNPPEAFLIATGVLLHRHPLPLGVDGLDGL